MVTIPSGNNMYRTSADPKIHAALHFVQKNRAYKIHFVQKNSHFVF
jgi:hypothetical protein